MLIIILNLTTVYANPYNNKEVVNTKEVVSATWYVWERLNTDYDIELPNWKSAENWYQSAKNLDIMLEQPQRMIVLLSGNKMLKPMLV